MVTMGIIIGTCVPDAEQDAVAYGSQLRRPPRRILYGNGDNIIGRCFSEWGLTRSQRLGEKLFDTKQVWSAINKK